MNMSEEVNSFEFDDMGMISEFKMNSMIFCTQKSINQIQIGSNKDQQMNSIPNNHQKLKNLSSIETQGYIQQGNYSNSVFKQNTIQKSDHKVELNSPSTQNPQIDSSELDQDYNENAKIPDAFQFENELNQENNDKLSNKYEESPIIPKQEKENGLQIDLNCVQKQIQNIKHGQNILLKSNSLDLTHMKNYDQYQERLEEKQNYTFDNGYQFRDSPHSSQYDSPRDSPQVYDGSQFLSKAIIRDDQHNNIDFGEAQYNLQYSAKKSKFHFEFNQLESDQKEQQNVFATPEQESKHNMMLRHFYEFQSFDQSNQNKQMMDGQQQSKNLFRSKSLYQSQHFKSSSKFQKVKHAIITIQRLAKNPATQINSINQLEDDLKSYRERSFSKQSHQAKKIETKIKTPAPSQSKDILKTETDEQEKQIYKKNYKEAFDGFRRREKMSLLCERGSEDDLKDIKNIIDTDPKKYLRDPKDPEHFLNSRNTKGLTPLYVSCKNGNLEVAKLLILSQCDYMITSKISKNLEETPFEAAVRWNHVEICNYMAEKCNFEDKYLIKCLPLCSNSILKKLIESKIKKKSAACSVF